jgi:uncharacterized cupin superfamily protein
MDYEVLHTDEIELLDLSEREDMPLDHSIRWIGKALGLEQLRAGLIYFEPGEEVGYHAHAEQEELYYVIEGRFSLKLGRSGETEIVEVGPGTFFAAGPEIGHGHRCVGEERGTLLALGAPAVDDPGLDPHELDP